MDRKEERLGHQAVGNLGQRIASSSTDDCSVGTVQNCCSQVCKKLSAIVYGMVKMTYPLGACKGGAQPGRF